MILQHNDRATAALDKPWFVPQGLVTSALESRGFTNIVWFENPPTVDMSDFRRTNSGTENTWLSATYSGVTTDFPVPSQVKWVAFMRNRLGVAQPKVEVVVEHSWLKPVGIAGIAIGILLLFKSGKRKKRRDNRTRA